MRVSKRVSVLLLTLSLGTAGMQIVFAEASDIFAASADSLSGQNSNQVIDLEDELVPLANVPSELVPAASGTAVEKNKRAEIDYSNTSDGYVMVRFIDSTTKRLKAQVIGPTTTYNYDIPVGKWITFPLSDGNGTYKVNIAENTSGTKYAIVLSASFKVTLKDEISPFLRSNQYVDFVSAPQSVKKAAELTKGITDPLTKVEKVYNFVVNNLTYDTEKAKTVKSGYLPVLDSVLAAKKGICFDYASLMAGMLRSQGVPCKLVVGYAGTAYHAWINVWTKETGWINGVIYFDGTDWKRMDPTFDSASNSSKSIMEFIGNGSNYTAKYLY